MQNNIFTLADSRLTACAEMVEGDFICDIGTDHGYLPAYLLTCGKCRHAIAADINQMPLNAARATFEMAEVLDKVDLYLSDGLEKIPLDDVTDIVIAGMGGELIYKIISSDDRIKNWHGNFIFQPMTRAEVLRENLYKNGFEITAEKGVVSGRFSYCVLKCRYTGNCREYEPYRYYLGKLDGKRDDDRKYILTRIRRLEKAGEGMKKQDPEKSHELLEIAENLRKEISL